jgi:trimeric autotransporter adhesin
VAAIAADNLADLHHHQQQQQAPNHTEQRDALITALCGTTTGSAVSGLSGTAAKQDAASTQLAESLHAAINGLRNEASDGVRTGAELGEGAYSCDVAKMMLAGIAASAALVEAVPAVCERSPAATVRSSDEPQRKAAAAAAAAAAVAFDSALGVVCSDSNRGAGERDTMSSQLLALQAQRVAAAAVQAHAATRTASQLAAAATQTVSSAAALQDGTDQHALTAALAAAAVAAASASEAANA